MKSIVFDFGNVVGFFDHNRTLDRLLPYTDLTRAEMYAAVYDSDLEDEFEFGRISVPDFLQQVARLWRLRSSADDFLEAAIADIFEPNTAVADLIPLLKGRYRLLLGSNTNPIHSRRFLAQFADTLAHFDGVVLSHAIGARKPRAEFFHECVRQAGCGAEECYFVDDLPANIAGAQAVGMRGLLYTRDTDLRQAFL